MNGMEEFIAGLVYHFKGPFIALRFHTANFGPQESEDLSRWEATDHASAAEMKSWGGGGRKSGREKPKRASTPKVV